MINYLIILISICMVLVGIFYLYTAKKERHKGLFVGGIAWLAGAYIVYQFNNLLPLPIVFLIALFLNKNPKHD